eukprot:GFUD01059053.1.p1 GENE.GFUD01059053.1~~GFUD01059053.1.p1  ORF type:complete len:173 (-),score=36.64 GFUD01059053.1:391-858(-)
MGDDKKEVARRNNCDVLKRKMDVDSLDDSHNDPAYCDFGENESETESDVYEFNDDPDGFNPFEKKSSDGSVLNPDSFNPFEKKSSEGSVFNPFEVNIGSKLPSVCSDGPLNSTECFNPFSSSSPNRSSNEQTKKANNNCPYCYKAFTSKPPLSIT